MHLSSLPLPDYGTHAQTLTLATLWESWSHVKLDHWHSYGFSLTKYLVFNQPSSQFYNEARVCIRFLPDSLWLIHSWNLQQVSSAGSVGLSASLHCCEGGREGGRWRRNHLHHRSQRFHMHYSWDGNELTLHLLGFNHITDDEYARWLEGDTDWLFYKVAWVELHMKEKRN